MSTAVTKDFPALRMPAEWEEHEAIWIAWPHEETDWPGKFAPISWVYAEIIRVIGASERVEILCHNDAVREEALACLDMHRVPAAHYVLHMVPNDRGWLRDSMPISVRNTTGNIELVAWTFKAWAKYDNYSDDQGVPGAVAKIMGKKMHPALRPDTAQPMSLEGGAIDVDGEGTLLTTEECLLSDIQERNPGLTREGYEAAFAKYLGITKTIWLGNGCAGDDTHGHVDDIARFVAPGKVVLAYESDRSDSNHEHSEDNYQRLLAAKDAKGRSLEVIKLPMPRSVWYGEERLPASYANFYIGNTVVAVPTFNDPSDRIALGILADCFPDRTVVGIHAVDLVLGQGTLHCLSQQQPR